MKPEDRLNNAFDSLDADIDNMIARYRTAKADREALLSACKKLANEAAGFLALSDEQRHGMTNSRILRERIEQARDIVRKIEGAK